ncbi:hypothetical protein AB0L97_15955 [Nocardia sp. NPDC051911]|uniref:hypothetical protein n=1 Tax=Nocardia sp. NPDC051911 TaxID=3154648 RepID=UPI00341EA81C
MTNTAIALPSPKSVHAPHLPANEARKPRAHAFFWPLLGAAATVSITGNATQALLHDTTLPAVAAGDDTPSEFSQLAARLCARDPARRRDPELVARALAHHHLDGWHPTRIARELDRSRSTIS